MVTHYLFTCVTIFTMNLEYIIDKKYDRQFIKGAKALRFFDAQYKQCRPYMEATLVLYQASWDEIGQEFSYYINNRSGYNWFYKSYTCVLSPIHAGISNWGREPIIVRTWEENPYIQRRITAHELIISHYFEIYRRYYSNKYTLTDGQVWALAEIAAFALTSLEDQKVKKFWPWDTSGYYIDHNYPQIVPLQKKLKQAFLKSNFDEYMKHGFKLVAEFPFLKP